MTELTGPTNAPSSRSKLSGPLLPPRDTLALLKRAEQNASVPPPARELLKPVASAEQYVRDPRGHYVADRSWLAYCAEAPSICGWSLWGEPDEGDVARMMASGEMLWSGLPRFPVLLDTRGLRRADPLAFEGVAAWIRKRRVEIEAVVTRFAVVHGPGLPGAVAAGFFAVVPLSLPRQLLEDRHAALAWLERSEAGAVLDLVEGLQATAGGDPLVGNLAAYLEEHLTATVADAAPVLSLSTRSLQRRLKERGTTFQHECDAARVRVAQRLLRDSSASLKRVALEVGCASPKDLGRVFKRVVGESPAGWRRRVLG